MSSVDLTTSEHDGLTVVVVRGELDVTGAAGAAAGLCAVVSGGRVVIADLAGLEFVDSSGLAALVRARRHARQRGGDLLLAAPQRQVQRILAITRLTDVFSVYPSLDQAAGSISAPQAAAPAPAHSGLLPAT